MSSRATLHGFVERGILLGSEERSNFFDVALVEFAYGLAIAPWRRVRASRFTISAQFGDIALKTRVQRLILRHLFRRKRELVKYALLEQTKHGPWRARSGGRHVRRVIGGTGGDGRHEADHTGDDNSVFHRVFPSDLSGVR
jgi:hypothetical protein